MTGEEFLAHIERDECRLALRQLYGCDARFNSTVTISTPVHGRASWRGSVHVFDISGHASATRGYAWLRQVNAHTALVHTALESDTVASPEQAVRSVLGRRQRSSQ